MSEIEKALDAADEVQIVGIPRGDNFDILVTIIKVLARRSGGVLNIPAAEYGAAADAPIALSINNRTKGCITASVEALTEVDRAVMSRMETGYDVPPAATPTSWV